MKSLDQLCVNTLRFVANGATLRATTTMFWASGASVPPARPRCCWKSWGFTPEATVEPARALVGR